MQTKYSARELRRARSRLRRALPAAARSGHRRPRGGGSLRRLGGAARRTLRAIAFSRGHRACAHVESARGRVARERRAAGRGMALYWILGLFSLVGGTASYAALLALVGLGARRALVALRRARRRARIRRGARATERAARVSRLGLIATLAAFNPELALFVPLGVGVAACVGAAALRLLRRRDARDPRADRLLVAWLALELVGFFVISPYPAVRRMIGLSIAATLLAARAAARRIHEARRARGSSHRHGAGSRDRGALLRQRALGRVGAARADRGRSRSVSRRSAPRARARPSGTRATGRCSSTRARRLARRDPGRIPAAARRLAGDPGERGSAENLVSAGLRARGFARGREPVALVDDSAVSLRRGAAAATTRAACLGAHLPRDAGPRGAARGPRERRRAGTLTPLDGWRDEALLRSAKPALPWK